MIKLEKIHKSYGEKIIFDNVNFQFKNKGLYLLKGENGSGKTTLFNIITNNDDNYKGNVVCGGNIFYLPYDRYLIKELTVKENIELNKDIFNNYKDIEDDLDIKKLNNRLVSKLSLGERQRLGIYLAFSSECEIVLLDEPLVGLDKKYKNKITELIKKESENKLVILVSHIHVDIQKIKVIEIKEKGIKGTSIASEIVNVKIEKKSLNKSIKWGIVLNSKQLIRKMMFIFSIFSIYITQQSITANIKTTNEKFNSTYNRGTLYYKDSKEDLNLDIFYDRIINNLALEIKDYYINIYSKKMYDTKVVINNKNINDGFLFSNIYEMSSLKENEIILQLNEYNYCLRNYYYNCNENSIIDDLKNNYIEYVYNGESMKFKVKEVVFSNYDSVYVYDLKIINNYLKKMYGYNDLNYEYSLNIYSHKLLSFYEKIYSLNDLLEYDFTFVYGDEKDNIFIINDKQKSNISSKEIVSNVIACSDIGFSCNSFNFGILNSLVYMDKYDVKDKVYYVKEELNIDYEEIIISDSLANHINKKVNDKIELIFYFDENFYKLEVKIMDIIKSDKFEIYHDNYDYSLYKDKFNKFLKIEYIYSDNNLIKYKKSELLNYEIVKETKKYIEKILLVIEYGILIIWFISIIILFVIETKKDRKHHEFYNFLIFNKVENIYIKRVTISYMSFYLIAGLILIENLKIFLIYNLIAALFVFLKFKKIKSGKSPD